MSQNSNNMDNQEIDLSIISRKIGSAFEKFLTSIFKGILFIKRNITIIGILFVVGFGIGVYLNQNDSYNHQIIVQPNFGSTDYLYAKIELLNSKIEEKDTVFLKEVVGIKDTKNLKKIAIEPILDIYKFVENKPENFDLIKLMAEDGDIEKIVKDKLTSKNYPFHLISFSTKRVTNYEKTIKPLLEYLNDSEYYKILQKQFLNNVRIKVIANDTIISQIDGFLNSMSNVVKGSQKSDKLVYYNENTQLDEVIKTKDYLIKEQGQHRLEMVNLDKIIKENSSTLNVKDKNILLGTFKFIIPIVLILIFVFISLLISFYKKQSIKLMNSQQTNN